MLRRHCDLSSWRNCERCALSESRRNVVLRGIGEVREGAVWRDNLVIYHSRLEPAEEQISVQGKSLHQYRLERSTHLEEHGRNKSSRYPFILFIGEAPGRAEDATGLPFQGESGRVFNLILTLCQSSFAFEITNTVGCRPTVWKRGKESNRQPTEREREACSPRLDKILATIPFEGIVYLGAVARKYKAPRGMPTVGLKHPALILRKEYKLHDIKLEARKLDQYVMSLRQERRKS